jgi:hypothetical protein
MNYILERSINSMVSRTIKLSIVIVVAVAITVIVVWYFLSSYIADSIANANKLEILGECLRSGGAAAEVEDDLVQSRVSPGSMINEDQLKEEWQSRPDLYKQDCYFRADLTPQQAEELGQ